MLRLFLRRKPAPAPRPVVEMPPVAPDTLVYAIGDVHGRADLLLRLLERIMEEAAEWGRPPQLVFLGDYIDRGDDVRDTLDILISVSEWTEVQPIFLMGNHEQMLLRFLANPVSEVRWLRVGGLQTLLSYGVPAFESTRDPDALMQLRDRLAEQMGSHLEFVEATQFCHLNGNLLFSHAGADPAVPPEDQTSRSLLWGHPAFPDTPRADGLWVVHGHVVMPEPVIDSGRIAIDTGAYHSNRLTAVRIGPEGVAFLST